jgi:ketosteroid isomerase-like protein
MKKVSRGALVSLALVIFCGISITAAKAQSLTSAPQPSPEIKSLTKALTGEWSLSVRFEPSAAAPNGLANTGEETWRPGPGGFTLLEEEHLRMPEGDLYLLGIVWWNTATKSLHGMECQNLLPYTCDVKGAQNDITMNWDGKQFVIDEIETSKSGKKSLWHEVWSEITPNSFTQTGEYGEPGGRRKRLFTIHATRVTATQSKNEEGGSSNANQSASNDAGPTAEMLSLTNALKGNWSTTYEFAPGGPFPTGGTGTGEENWRTGPGGYVLMEEEHVRAPSQEMFLIALHWWDKTTNKLRGILCNNSGPAACDFNTYSDSSLNWDGKRLTINLEFPQDEKKMTWHEVWSGITADSFTQTGEMGEVGSPLKRALTIHGTKLAPETASTSAIAEIKAAVAQVVAGINAHDPTKTTAYDVPDIISMECGSPSTVGIEADREGFRLGFQHDPLWKVSLIDEAVDVAGGGDLAVYRGTYNEDNGRDGVLMTHRTNFIAEFKRQSDGSWRIVWYSVSNMERPHPK